MAHLSSAQVVPFHTPHRLKTLLVSMTVLGLLSFVTGFFIDIPRILAAFLTSFVFVTGLASGLFFFVAIQFISKAGWSASIRRVAEASVSYFPMIFVGSVVIVVGAKFIFPWVDEEYLQVHPIVQAKTAYLNVPFMTVRLLIFAMLMWFFGTKIVGNSLAQDQSGEVDLTHRNVFWSILWVIAFALSFSFFAVDLLMSLLPTWYSTIFGIYLFAGSFQAALALLIILLILLRQGGWVRGFYGEDHIHDLAKYLKGMSVFWAYIAFSQFMLIWYANIPEETEFYLLRAQQGWLGVSIALFVFKFVVPFLALLPRNWKRNESHVFAVSLLVIASQYLDVFWLVYPNFNDHALVFGVWEVGLLIGMLGIFGLCLTRFFEKNSLVAIKDPRLHEALHHHVTY